MKKIQLSRGQLVIVDDEDFENINQWKWYLDGGGYARRTVYTGIKNSQSAVLMHRIINKTPTGFHTDHINADKLDNRKINLRNAHSHENQGNARKLCKSSSRYKGVAWHDASSKWSVQIGINRKRMHLGIFDDELDAAKCYDVHAVKYFGEFARLNFGGKQCGTKINQFDLNANQVAASAVSQVVVSTAQ